MADFFHYLLLTSALTCDDLNLFSTFGMMFLALFLPFSLSLSLSLPPFPSPRVFANNHKNVKQKDLTKILALV